MTATASRPAPGYRRILALAIPVILANSATPMLGLVDTAVIGHTGSAVDLGAIALGSLLFSFLFWGFGFLRMSTSGFVAQAEGRGDTAAVASTLLRGLLLGSGIGLLLMLLQAPLLALALRLFGASAEVSGVTRAYFEWRIWGAPATLCLYVLMGYLIGSGATRLLLAAQLLLNGLNALLDVLFAGVLGWGAPGIGLGTALAEWLTLALLGAWLWRRAGVDRATVVRHLRRVLADAAGMRQLLAANGDILLRTLSLLLGFALFTDQGARLGDVTLAANHVLLQLVAFSAFFLDGFAFTTEALAGRAWGAGQRQAFRDVLRRSSVLAGLTALLLALLWLGVGPWVIGLLTGIEPVREAALAYLPFCALYVLLSFAAFQLDGLFIGTTRTRALRNASLLSTGLFALCLLPLVALWGNAGLWSAFVLFVVLRALALLLQYPAAFRGLR